MKSAIYPSATRAQAAADLPREGAETAWACVDRLRAALNNFTVRLGQCHPAPTGT